MKLKLFLFNELKGHPFFFILFFLSLLLGTLSLVGIEITSTQVKKKLDEKAGELLTSDLSVSARRELSESELAKLDEVFRSFDHDRYKVIDIYSMISRLSDGASRLVEIRATEKGFPFYGKLTLADGEFDSNKVFISKDLSDMWQLRAGEQIKVGELTAEISGIVLEDSSMGQRGLSLAPRIYFPLKLLPQTGLVRLGSTGSFAHHFKLKAASGDTANQLKNDIYKMINDGGVRVTLPENSSEQTGRVIRVISNFMSLSALIGLVLSLVGVFYLYQSYLIARLKDLCLFNLHGMSKWEMNLALMLQFSFVFGVVILVELILISSLYHYLAPVLSDFLGIELSLKINSFNFISHVFWLYLISLFILVPLYLGLLRTQMGIQLKSSKIALGQFRWFDFIPFILILWFFSVFISQSLKIGSIFFFSLLAVFLISSFTIGTFQWLIKILIKNKNLRLPSLEMGIALRNLSRSGHKMSLSFLSLVIATTLISLILQLDKIISMELTLSEEKPTLFLFDIQEDQLEPLEELFKKQKAQLDYVTPMIRARLEKVNGVKFKPKKRDLNLRDADSDEVSRTRNNALNLTYRHYLTDSEKIIKGDPFPDEYDPKRLPFISIEKRWSQRMGVNIGDVLTFDVQGVEFEGKVINLKEIKWTSFYPNFFVTIEPGIIDGAPKTYLAIVPRKLREMKLNLQRLTVETFPNISFIDVEQLVDKLSVLFTKSRQAIEFISWLSLLVGLVILYALSYDQVYRRYYDLALLKTLGLSPNKLRFQLIFEFGSVFVLALSLGFFLGHMMAFLIGKEVFKVSSGLNLSGIALPALSLILLCLITIILSSWRVIQVKPRELLADN